MSHFWNVSFLKYLFFTVDCDAMYHWFLICWILLPWIWIKERIETDFLYHAYLRQLVAQVSLPFAYHYEYPIALRHAGNSYWEVLIFFSKSLFSLLRTFLSNRYIAICHPFLLQQERLKPNRSAAAQSQQSSTNGMSLKKRTCLYMLPVILISFLVNIPKFMEFRNTTR